MAFYEMNNGQSVMLHFIGIVLVLGRITHAIGLTISEGTTIYRQFGMLTTFFMLIALSVVNIFQYFI